VVGAACAPKTSPAERRAAHAEGPELSAIANYAESIGLPVHAPTADRVFAHPGRAKEIDKLWRQAARDGDQT
jgi:hypothetical protein